MKQIFTLLFSIFFLSSYAQINIPNASFETWDTGTYFIPHVPRGWVAGGSFPDVTKVTDAHSGSYAMKVSVAQYFTGVGCTGTSSAFSTPTSSTPALHYSYWAKVHLRGNDKFETGADLTNTGSTASKGNIDYATSFLDTNSNTSVWKHIVFPIITSSPGPYDSVTLTFIIGNATDTSSYVIVDDLAFDFGNTGIASIADESIIETVYPNPAQHFGTIIYTLNESSSVHLDIYDLLGNKISTVVDEKQSVGRYKADIDLDSYPNGVYLVNLTSVGKSHIQKLIVQH